MCVYLIRLLDWHCRGMAFLATLQLGVPRPSHSTSSRLGPPFCTTLYYPAHGDRCNVFEIFPVR